MKIGNLNFDKSVFLAPMAGVTDISFRGLCKEMGCGLVYTEMVSAKALYYGSENTKSLLRIADEEKPVAAQIFGNDPKIMSEVVKSHFNNMNDICILDINMGCPAPKITKNGEGSALMLNPKLAGEIVSEIKKVSNKPVTVKFRKGYDDDNINAVEFAKMMEYSGADAIAIHGRTKKQMYEGKADWDIIKKVKQSVNIPVIGNGDIVDEESALQMFEQTGVDGIMIGRGSFGNPWIFRNIKHYLETGEKLPQPTNNEKLEVMEKHIKLAVKEKGEDVAIKELRKHIAWYTKNLKNSSEFRNSINKVEKKEELISKLEEYFKTLD